jgi:selenophosphate synthase
MNTKRINETKFQWNKELVLEKPLGKLIKIKTWLELIEVEVCKGGITKYHINPEDH